MAISSQDSLGTFLDTGVNTAPTIRASVEVETHVVGEIDSGSTLTAVTVSTKHIPHRPVNHPR